MLSTTGSWAPFLSCCEGHDSLTTQRPVPGPVGRTLAGPWQVVVQRRLALVIDVSAAKNDAIVIYLIGKHTIPHLEDAYIVTAWKRYDMSYDLAGLIPTQEMTRNNLPNHSSVVQCGTATAITHYGTGNHICCEDKEKILHLFDFLGAPLALARSALTPRVISWRDLSSCLARFAFPETHSPFTCMSP